MKESQEAKSVFRHLERRTLSSQTFVLGSFSCIKIDSFVFQILYQQSILVHASSHTDFNRTPQMSKIMFYLAE